MGGLLYPALFALFVWWFSTGIVLLLDNLPRRTFPWSMAAGTALFAVVLVRLAQNAADTSLAGAYAAFTYAVIAWAWQEMSFFMGFVTGPRRIAAPEGCSTGERFRAGVAACLWHELAILATGAVILATTWGAPNQVGAWTYLLLYAMRQSAKLNVFLGVLNLGEEFLPAHLRYLVSFMSKRPMNLLMPFSITGGTIAAAMLAQAAGTATTEVQAAGLAMLATMMALAVIEHWCLILPLPFAKLWAWSLKFKPGHRKARRYQPGAPAPTRPQPPGGTSHGLPALLP